MSLQLIEIKSCDFEVKTKGKTGEISGYGSVFGGNDSYGDTIEKGAFAEALKKNEMPKMLYQHDWWQIIGEWTSVNEDSKGLAVEGKIFTDVTGGSDAYKLMKRGVLSGLSIGFRASKTEKKKDKGRIIKSIDYLPEISIVTFPADKAAQAEAKNTTPHYYDQKSFAYLISDRFDVSLDDAEYIAKHGYDKFLEMRAFDRSAFFGDVVSGIEAIKSEFIN